MSHYTYMVTNKINGKVYVGSHSWKNEGIDKNYYGSGTAIKRAVKKYGKENFQVEVLYYYDTVEECRKDEERILTEYNVRDCPHSYNLKNSAMGMSSEDVTEEFRKKMSQAMKRVAASEEFRRKLSQANKGKTLSEEHKQKISQAHKGKTFSEEHRKKLSQAMKGKAASDEHRQKLSRALKGRTLSAEHRKKLSRARKNIMTPIVAIQKDTGKIRMFESQLECSRVLGVYPVHIHNCLKGRQKTCKGYIIKHLKRCSMYYKITKRKAKKTEKIKLTIKRKGATPLVAIQKDTGRVRMFLSQHECNRVLGINRGNVNNCLNGRQKTCKGYTFKKINRDKRVFTVSPRSKEDI